MDILIIGAGAAGLTAARFLSKLGNQVVVIEARERIGGRIHTLHDPNFTKPVETGAEFIHGDLKRTKTLLREANISFYKGEGKAWNVYDGRLEAGDFFQDGWDEMLEKLKALKHDMPIAEFLETHLGDQKYQELRDSIIKFVSGYDAADPKKVSAFGLREEWTGDEDITGYHPSGGYGLAIDFLKKKCDEQNVRVHLSTVVKEVMWQQGLVTLQTSTGEQFSANKVLITIPPAVLKTTPVKFTPEIPEHMEAIRKIETGGVIKFLVEFQKPYWEEKAVSGFRSMADMHFLFSDAPIPTWWTQKPDPTPLLTGWLAGPVLDTIDMSDDNLLHNCYASLSYLFETDEASLKEKIRAIKIINWKNDPFACGAYAYKTIHSNEIANTLSKPVADTIYFGGEGYYNGPEMGTVEAALSSGSHQAELMKAQLLY